MKIYLVKGQTDNYDEEMEWIVCAYKKKSDAESHKKAANKITYDFFERNKRGDGEFIAIQALGTCVNPYDEFMQMEAGGTTYFIETTELFEEFE